MTQSLNAYTASQMQLGYGAASVNILLSLEKLDTEITWFPIGNPVLTIPKHEQIKKWIDRQNNFNANYPSFTCWHENQLALRLGKGLNYALSFFELNKLNPRRISHLNSVDHILTPSKWGESVLKEHDIKPPISVIPMGVDTQIFRPQKLEKEKDKFVVLVMGKWEIRKSHDLIPDIFHKAFENCEDVEFWMVTNNVFLTQEETCEWQYYYQSILGEKLREKIRFISPLSTDIELANLMNKVSCGLSLSKSEGWDLPLLQMMACGIPVIATNYSAHTEFCTSKNSYLIDIDELEVAFDGKWFGEGTDNQGEWAKIGPPQINQTISHLKYLYKNRPDNPNGIKTAHKLTWNACASKLKEIIYPKEELNPMDMYEVF